MKSFHSKRKTRKHLYTMIMIGIVLLITGGFFYLKYGVDNQSDEDYPKETEENNEPESETEPEPDPEPEESYTEIRISAAGDIMFHDDQLEGAYDQEKDTYDFSSTFEEVKPIFQDADLALANYETTAAGSSREYTGYPTFNSPDESLDAIKDAGIDVLTTTNNHSLDSGSEGLKRTARVIREKGIDSVGTYDEEPESRVLMKEVKGIKIAIIAYTESTNGLGDQYPANELHAMINLMEKDLILEDIQEAKENDADLIISFMHWGEEYAEEPNAKQVEYAEMMAKEGVDIILGSHPHVIQKSEVLSFDDRESFVIYSMGNFVSNQRLETLDNELTEDGIIVNFDIRQHDETKETTIEKVEYIPTWVYRDKEEGESTYTHRILPIENFVDATDISSAFKKRMERSFDSTVSKMEKEPF